MKAVVAALNQEKALVGAFSVITNLRMELFEALLIILKGSIFHFLIELILNPCYSLETSQQSVLFYILLLSRDILHLQYVVV